MFWLKKGSYLGIWAFLTVWGLFLGAYLTITNSIDPWFATQSAELLKWIYFIDVLKWYINFILLHSWKIFVFVWCFILITNREVHKNIWLEIRETFKQQTSVPKKIVDILGIGKKIIVLHSRYFWGLILCGGAWFIISIVFHYVNFWDVTDREWVWSFLEEIKIMQEQWVNIWLETLYDKQLVSNINYSLWFVSIWMLMLIILAWLISALSFWNKVWRWFSSVLLLLVLLLFLIWGFLHFLSIELAAWII